jgi:hypothetical protein
MIVNPTAIPKPRNIPTKKLKKKNFQGRVSIDVYSSMRARSSELASLPILLLRAFNKDLSS